MKYTLSKSKESQADELHKLCNKFIDLKDGDYSIEIKKVRDIRTQQQQNAMELWFRLVAKELEAAGISRVMVLSSMTSQMPWSQESVKDLIWRRSQEALGFGIRTSGLSVEKVTKVYDICNRFLGERIGIHVPFPTKEHTESEESI